jgi:hypothetical protein
LDNFAVNGSPKFPKIDFICKNGQYSVRLNGINIFEWGIEHLNIGVTVLHYDTEFEQDEQSSG